MNTHNTIESTENRLLALERSAGRWRLAALTSLALLGGIVIGGMANNSASSTQPTRPNRTSTTPTNPTLPSNPNEIIGFAGTADTLYRLHRNGSVTYLRIPKGERTAHGFYSWGDIIIDKSKKSRNLPQ